MTRFSYAITTVAFLSIVTSTDAMATAQRTFVATYGSDANPCSLALPCRAFAAAISQTSPGGEVLVLNSGGYGSVTIAQSVSIIAPPGVYAGISVTTVPGNGVTITAGVSDIVVLRGLTITGPGVPVGEAGSNGVEVQSAGVVHVEGLVVSGFRSTGLSVNAPGVLYLSDLVLRENLDGAFVAAPTGGLTVSVDRLRVESNFGEGLVAGGNVRVAIRESVFSGNQERGIRAFPAPGAPSDMVVENCSFSGNDEGILSGSTGDNGATIRLSNSTISYNFNGLRFINSNKLLSGGGNTLEANANDGTFSGIYTKK